MGKKKSSGKHYVSKGQVPTVSRKTLKAGRREYSGSLAQAQARLTAYSKGQPISDETLLTLGPRNTAETTRYKKLRNGKD